MMKTRNTGVLFALLAGLLAGLLLRPMALGEGSPARAQPPQQAPTPVLQEVGRYAVAATPAVESDTRSFAAVVYVIDTRTGNVWRRAQMQGARWEAQGSPRDRAAPPTR